MKLSTVHITYKRYILKYWDTLYRDLMYITIKDSKLKLQSYSFIRLIITMATSLDKGSLVSIVRFWHFLVQARYKSD